MFLESSSALHSFLSGGAPELLAYPPYINFVQLACPLNDVIFAYVWSKLPISLLTMSAMFIKNNKP
jgi:hypothetical protein